MSERMDIIFKDVKNYKILKETFNTYWMTHDITNKEGTEKEKAFLLYVKGFNDGIDFIKDDEHAKSN